MWVRVTQNPACQHHPACAVLGDPVEKHPAGQKHLLLLTHSWNTELHRWRWSSLGYLVSSVHLGSRKGMGIGWVAYWQAPQRGKVRSGAMDGISKNFKCAVSSCVWQSYPETGPTRARWSRRKKEELDIASLPKRWRGWWERVVILSTTLQRHGAYPRLAMATANGVVLLWHRECWSETATSLSYSRGMQMLGWEKIRWMRVVWRLHNLLLQFLKYILESHQLLVSIMWIQSSVEML